MPVFVDLLQAVLVEPPWSPVFELIMQFDFNYVAMKYRISSTF